MEPPDIRYAKSSDGLALAYIAFGRGQGRPLIFAANQNRSVEYTIGNPDILGWYEAVAEDRLVVCYDFRGFGLSAAPPDAEGYSVAQQADDISSLASHLGLAEFDVWGVNNSVRSALEVAKADNRVRHVVCSRAGMVRPYVAPNRNQAIATLRNLGDKELWCRNVAGFMVGAGPEVDSVAAELDRAVRSFSQWEAVTVAFESMDVLDPSGLERPVLVLYPEVDGATDDVRALTRSRAQELARDLPDGRFRPLPGAVSVLDRSPVELVWPVVKAFLDEGREAIPSAGGQFRTILFTDVVSSTPLLTQLRDARMREVMRDHDAVMEAAVTGHGGRVVKTIGDAFMAEFAEPSAAVEAAIEAQRAIREKFVDSDVPVRIRIGINAGEPIEEDGDLHGASVVIAKCLESAADTNGILVSDVVKQAVSGKEFDFEDRGAVELKGFDEPMRAWAVRWE
jgi:class 3 adenylate cyclase